MLLDINRLLMLIDKYSLNVVDMNIVLMVIDINIVLMLYI